MSSMFCMQQKREEYSSAGTGVEGMALKSGLVCGPSSARGHAIVHGAVHGTAHGTGHETTHGTAHGTGNGTVHGTGHEAVLATGHGAGRGTAHEAVLAIGHGAGRGIAHGTGHGATHGTGHGATHGTGHGVAHGTADGEQEYRLKTSGEKALWRARLAASCLLTPEPGDEVLFAPLPDGRAFILAVLTRGTTSAKLEFPHGATVQSGAELRLVSRTALNMTAPESSMRCAKVHLDASELTVSAAVCSLLSGTLKAIGERVEGSFSKLFARLGSSNRIIAEQDNTQAGSIHMNAAEEVTTQAETITQQAGTTVSIDAPQIYVS